MFQVDRAVSLKLILFAIHDFLRHIRRCNRGIKLNELSEVSFALCNLSSGFNTTLNSIQSPSNGLWVIGCVGYFVLSFLFCSNYFIAVLIYHYPGKIQLRYCVRPVFNYCNSIGEKFGYGSDLLDSTLFGNDIVTNAPNRISHP